MNEDKLKFEGLYLRTLQLLGTALKVINDYERGLGFGDDELTDAASLIVMHDAGEPSETED